MEEPFSGFKVVPSAQVNLLRISFGIFIPELQNLYRVRLYRIG
jgi:hypothetical protein